MLIGGFKKYQNIAIIPPKIQNFNRGLIKSEKSHFIPPRGVKIAIFGRKFQIYPRQKSPGG